MRCAVVELIRGPKANHLTTPLPSMLLSQRYRCCWTLPRLTTATSGLNITHQTNYKNHHQTAPTLLLLSAASRGGRLLCQGVRSSWGNRPKPCSLCLFWAVPEPGIGQRYKMVSHSAWGHPNSIAALFKFECLQMYLKRASMFCSIPLLLGPAHS